MTWRQKLGLVALGAAVALCVVGVAWWLGHRATPTASEEVRQELAEHRIEAVKTEAKVERKAARSKVDKEVQHAADTGDLVDFIERHSGGR